MLQIFEMIGGHVCGFHKEAVIVPISIEPRPAVFNLSWFYSVVNYLLNTVSLLNSLLQFHKPAVEMCLNNDLAFRYVLHIHYECNKGGLGYITSIHLLLSHRILFSEYRLPTRPCIVSCTSC